MAKKSKKRKTKRKAKKKYRSKSKSRKIKQYKKKVKKLKIKNNKSSEKIYKVKSEWLKKALVSKTIYEKNIVSLLKITTDFGEKKEKELHGLSHTPKLKMLNIVVQM